MNSQCKLKWRSTPVLGKLSRHCRHLIASGTVKNLLVVTKSLCFSDYTDKSALASDIGKYFVQKISRLREELYQGYVLNDQSYVLDDMM